MTTNESAGDALTRVDDKASEAGGEAGGSKAGAVGPTCARCGAADYPTNYMDCGEARRMKRDGICFYCACWSLRSERKHKTVIDGALYSPGPRRTGSFLGMAGRRFDIEYLSDKRRITTFDLWYEGKVPDHWRDAFPDTARFLGDAERVELEGHIQTCWNPSDKRAPEFPAPTSELYEHGES